MNKKNLSTNVKIDKSKRVIFLWHRENMLLKHDYKCQECGKQFNKTKLHLHHKNQNRKDHAIENLVLLCYKCHRDIHTQENNKNYTMKKCNMFNECHTSTTAPHGYCFKHYKKLFMTKSQNNT